MRVGYILRLEYWKLSPTMVLMKHPPPYVKGEYPKTPMQSKTNITESGANADIVWNPIHDLFAQMIVPFTSADYRYSARMQVHIKDARVAHHVTYASNWQSVSNKEHHPSSLPSRST